MDVLAATDFFTTEVWTQGGLVTYYVLFFIHLATRRVYIAGITPHPNEQWMTQVARNVTNGRCRLSVFEPISYPRPGLQVLRVVPAHH